MPTTKYLGTEISTTVEAGSGREIAHVILDGVRLCFLNGTPEARTYLRERKQGPHYWPRPVSYAIRLDGKMSDNTTCSSRTSAYSELEYWRLDGRTAAVVRYERCATPGCYEGKIATPPTARKKFGSTRDCPCHTPTEEFIETSTDL